MRQGIPTAEASATTRVREVQCETAPKFLEALSFRGEFFSSVKGQWVFRGLCDGSFELLAKAFRPAEEKFLLDSVKAPRSFGEPENEGCRIEGGLQDLGAQVFAEMDLLWRFLQVVDLSGLPVPGDSPRLRDLLKAEPAKVLKSLLSNSPGVDVIWPENVVIPLMALAQHFGLPTRLLDWTRSPLVAAYFAAAEAAKSRCQGGDPSHRLAVWAMDRSVPMEIRRHPNRTGNRYMEFVGAPMASNRNLHAQNGLFSVERIFYFSPGDPIDREPLDKLDCAAQGHPSRELPQPLFVHLTLPQAEAAHLLWLLAREGITGARCFPDYDGVTRHLRETLLWDRRLLGGE